MQKRKGIWSTGIVLFILFIHVITSGAVTAKEEFNTEKATESNVNLLQLLQDCDVPEKYSDASVYTSLTNEQKQEIRKKALSITHGLTSTEEKVKAIYTYLGTATYYDYYLKDGRDPSGQEPYTVYLSKLALSEGYAKLFDFMLNSIGIPSICISGYRLSNGESWETKSDYKPYEQNGYGYWNAVYIDGVWKYFDLALDSKNSYIGGEQIAQEMDYLYFGMNGELFSINHMPISINIEDGRRIYKAQITYRFKNTSVLEELEAFDIPEQAESITIECAMGGFPIDPNIVTKVSSKTDTIVTGTSYTEIPDSFFQSADWLKKVVLSEGTKKIGKKAFAGCKNLTSVILPDSIEQIGDSAFEECTALANIKFPTELTEIGDYSFYESGLLRITIPSNTIKIGTGAFSSCNNLSKVIMRDGVKIIAPSAFEWCPKLTEVTLSGKTETLGSHSFNGCEKLETIDLPDSLKTIGAEAFADSGLKQIVIPQTVTYIGKEAFRGCKSLERAYLSDNMKLISDGLFSYCSSLTTVRLPKQAQKIGKFAFEQCIALEYITIPDQVKVVYTDAFLNCNGLKQVVFGTSVQKVGFSCFSGCYQLKEVIWKAKTPPSLAASFRIPKNTKIYVRRGYTAAYRTAFQTVSLIRSQKNPITPLKAFTASSTQNTITASHLNGYYYKFMYSLDGNTYQESNVFRNLKPQTEYTVYARSGGLILQKTIKTKE